MGTKVPLITAAYAHNRRAGTTNPHKPNSDGHKHDHDGQLSHRLSHPRTTSGNTFDIVAGVNGASNGHLSQPTTYGTTGPLDKFGVTRVLHSSPERQRLSTTGSLLNRVPEDGAMTYDHEEGGSRFIGGGSFDVDEEEEDLESELDEELAAEGLYKGSYWRLLAFYTFVPFTFIVVFTLLAVFPAFAWPTDRTSPFPYPPYFPFPLPEFQLAITLWSLSYLLRDPLYAIAVFLSSAFYSTSPSTPVLLSTALHSFTSLVIQQSAIPLLLIPHYTLTGHPTSEDPAFRRVWWVALGWATAEAVVAIHQGYEAIGLYQDVLVAVRQPQASSDSVLSAPKSQNDDFRLPLHRSPTDTSPRPTPVPGNSAIDLLNRDFEDEVFGQTERLDADGVGNERQPLLPRQSRIGRQESELKMQLNRDVDQLLALKGREELEEVYGMPVIDIPVFLSCLQRVNAILLSLGVYLLFSSAYIRSNIALPLPTPDVPTYTNTALKITLPLVFILQFCLAILHTSLVIPRIGVHTVVYAGSMVSLGSFFAGLGVWEALS